MTNNNLPVFDFKDRILETIIDNQVTIIVAETGAGKSTQVPQYLLDLGLEIIVTEPRRIAARSVAKRVAYEYGCKFGQEVGFRTAFERQDSENTKCIFCTDGLELVRSLHSERLPDVLVIDEVHEWNVNIETLVAWSKRQIADNPDFKVVIMSATIEAGRLSQYFNNAPIIEVPGRLFPVETRKSEDYDVVMETARLVRQGRNVLVFQPGKAEISKTIEKLQEELQMTNTPAAILPLHGDLDTAEQDDVFRSYHSPKVVVATNIAQTSITIDDIDAVVDSGLEKRIETSAEGIEGLYLKRTSKADDEQRKGRAGRCRPGIYINCHEPDYLDTQPDFPKAEIERVRLDQLVLRFLRLGIDPEELEFFHQPEKQKIIDAKNTLYALGAIDKNDQVTAIGKEMNKLPCSVNFARMIVEAKKHDILEPVVTIAACLEVNGIHQHKAGEWRYLTQEQESDLLAQLDLFRAAWTMRGKDDFKDNGINKKSYFRAKEIREKLLDVCRNGRTYTPTYVQKEADRKLIIRTCLTGLVDHVYQRTGTRGECRNGDAGTRYTNNSTVVTTFIQDWLVGLPIDIRFKNRFGNTQTMNLVSMISKVKVQDLVEIAPHLAESSCDCHYNGNTGTVSVQKVVNFNGMMIPEEDKKEVTWQELFENYLPEGVTGEAFRIHFLMQEFEKHSGSFGKLRREFLGVYYPDYVPSLVPTTFCIDPATGKDVKAYPAIVRSEGTADTMKGYYKKFYLTPEEARANQAKGKQIIRVPEKSRFDSGFSRGPIYSDDTEKIKIPSVSAKKAPEATGEWEYTGKRWWKCPNGHTAKAGKKAKSVTCDICGQSHDIN